MVQGPIAGVYQMMISVHYSISILNSLALTVRNKETPERDLMPICFTPVLRKK